MSNQNSNYIALQERPNMSGPTSTEQIQDTVNQTINVMKDNVQKMAVRDDQLNRLEEGANNLAESAGQFRQQSQQVKKRMWVKNTKMKVCLAIGIIVLIAVIVIPLVVHFT
ncbi:uncharacterized protein SAPINGB_P000479 [Magnusiomyces paraingens]|uniref:V-SNARE coiled-coil homology domain-containing protein n=1 Tax=Magnusiomyces paraingens TaxID=2606893 RepID=A0A5E8B024_9ASCO|nr:uncharacterized protein SAPINGB_P000479 [Saprochaete ingens]VVT44627.1 unnamed protein product [Saprochaete ingens]